MSSSKVYILALLTCSYIAAELGHFIIGTTTKSIAEDLHYGDISCQQNNTNIKRYELVKQCVNIENEPECNQADFNGSSYCEWNYNGLGFEYQILAGPAYMFVFTVMGVLVGFAADRFNRVNILSICIFTVGVALVLQGMVKEYWQLVILRMVLAAGASGCTPLATGIISDIFPINKRAFANAVFNAGIYIGYGLSFPVGRDLVKAIDWRVSYYGIGLLIVILVGLIKLAMDDPRRQQHDGIEMQRIDQKNEEGEDLLLKVILKPQFLLIMLSASIRHCAGLTFAYNCDLYFLNYFPDVDLGWWLFGITIVTGCIGVLFGGWVSDKLVTRYGLKSRLFCLAISSVLATPPAIGVLNLKPIFALISMVITNLLSEMWFGILFAVLVEIVPSKVCSRCVGILLFVMNNLGGNLPILVDPLAKSIGYREALTVFFAGSYALSGLLFFLSISTIKKKAIPNRTGDRTL